MTPHSLMRLYLKFGNPGSEFVGTRHTVNELIFMFYSDLIVFPDFEADFCFWQFQSNNMSNVKVRPDIVDLVFRKSRKSDVWEHCGSVKIKKAL